jgi:hypothetical protein
VHHSCRLWLYPQRLDKAGGLHGTSTLAYAFINYGRKKFHNNWAQILTGPHLNSVHQVLMSLDILLFITDALDIKLECVFGMDLHPSLILLSQVGVIYPILGMINPLGNTN